LATVRKFVGGFDAKTLDAAYARKPRTENGKKQRRAALAKVARTYKKLQPFLQRSHKRVKPRNPKHVAAIAEYANVPKLKGLRAVPVATEFPKKFKVKVDRKGRVSATRGAGFKEVLYKFPRKPRAHVVGGKFITAGEDAIAMAEAMLPTMKPGLYVLMSNLHDIIQFTADRESLLQTLRSFVFAYEKTAADWMPYLKGFKYLARSYDAARKRLKTIETIRFEARGNRRTVQQKWEAQVKANTEFKRRMRDRKRIKAEQSAKKFGKQSRRAKLTGRR
jgi:hypothetical protein